MDYYSNFCIPSNKHEVSNDYYEWSAMSHIIGDYNTGTSYGYEVTELAQTIKEEFYKETNDTLDRKKNGL
ncbi:MAG: hypothetical protein IPJ26_07235 [Bacteroidetes bacterium]|nr:hypothetical protein [Bacteroidota bacterium]